MKHVTKARFPNASSDLVIKAMTDKKFHTDRLEKQGHTNYEILDYASDGKNFRIKFKRKQPVNAPGVVKKFVSAESVVIHEDSWNVATKTGKVVVELPGMPVQMSCVTTLKDEGKDCVLTYDWDIKSSVPLVGGTIEKTIAAENDKAIPEQTRVGIELLKNYQ